MTTRRLFRFFALLALLPVLAACPAATTKTSAPKTSPAPAIAAVPAPPEPEQPKLLADDLMGLDTEGLAKLLGEPDFRRVDAPAELWQYRTEVCMLDVFLYRNANKPDSHAVTHIAARGHGEATVTEDACVAAAHDGKS